MNVTPSVSATIQTSDNLEVSMTFAAATYPLRKARASAFQGAKFNV